MRKHVFGQNIRDAITTMRGDAQPVGCAHCWHGYGPRSGGVSSDGLIMSCGRRRCCRCGLIESYEYKGKMDPQQHGPFYREIVEYPA